MIRIQIEDKETAANACYIHNIAYTYNRALLYGRLV